MAFVPYLLFLLFLLVFVLGGAWHGWRSAARNNALQKQLSQLQQELRVLRQQQLNPEPADKPMEPAADTTAAPMAAAATTQTVAAAVAAMPPASTRPREKLAVITPEPTAQWLQHLQANWMVWLGGVCVALAGIFMVRYSIEQGLLGPAARIGFGVLTGAALHVTAEWLRRHRGAHMAFAALAGGGSITLFAALLSALHLYQLLSPLPVFGLLAIVALVSMWLALLHGPVLAVLGIFGAYLVPVLVGGEGGNAHMALLYSLIITVSALLLMRYLQRQWIWISTVAFSLLWWLLTREALEVDAVRGLYLAAVAYLLLAVPVGDWWLAQRSSHAGVGVRNLFASTAALPPLLPVTLLLLIAASGISLANVGTNAGYSEVNWLALPLLLLFVAGRQQALGLHAWCLLLTQLIAVLLSRYESGTGLQAIAVAALPAFYRFCAVATAVYAGMALWNFRSSGSKALWISLAVMSPLAWLTLSYLLTSTLQISLQWSLWACLLGGMYLALAAALLAKQAPMLVVAWLFIAGHLGYSLAATMYFREAGLTLALALQIVSLSWIIRRFRLDQLDLVFKLVVMVVITRLSLNPWLAEYAARVQWPLWTYVGASLCCIAGVWLLQPRPLLRVWAFGASLHLAALSLWVLLRYFLYDGAVFGLRYDLLETVLNQNIFAALALIYYWRSRFSEHLAFLCRLYAKLLLVFAVANYGLILLWTLGSSTLVYRGIGTTPLVNLLLLAYGTPVLFGWLCWRYYLRVVQRFALAFAALAAFVFIAVEIMHLWRGHVQLDGDMTDAELYTYSIVWLLLAVAAILGGVWRFGTGCYRTGMALLVLVIAKLFLVDMAGLTGLLRVASFMGMGLGLLAIAYLHQRLQLRSRQQAQ